MQFCDCLPKGRVIHHKLLLSRKIAVLDVLTPHIFPEVAPTKRSHKLHKETFLNLVGLGSVELPLVSANVAQQGACKS